VLPGKDFSCKVSVEQPLLNEQLEYPPSEYLGEQRCVFDRNVMERTLLADPTFQNKAVVVRVPSHQVAI